MPPTPQKISVTDMPRASVAEDGSIVEMELRGKDDGECVVLQFDPAQLWEFQDLVNQLTQQARIQKAASAGHLEVPLLRVAEASAQAAVGGAKVTVSFRIGNGQVYAFGLEIAKAQDLHNELVAAIASAKKQSRQTRQ